MASADRRAVELDAGAAEVDRLAQIVEELLVLSRAGERELPGERLELRAVVERALVRWRATAAERGIALENGGTARRSGVVRCRPTPTARSTCWSRTPCATLRADRV